MVGGGRPILPEILHAQMYRMRADGWLARKATSDRALYMLQVVTSMLQVCYKLRPILPEILHAQMYRMRADGWLARKATSDRASR